jgi:hypothetical protein
MTALIVAGLLTAGGGAAVGWAATHQQHAPRPSSAAAGTLVPTSPPAATNSDQGPAQSGRPATIRPTGPLLAASRPTALTIPAISVQAPLDPLGRNPDGSFMVPQPGPHYNDPGWFTGSRTPGELGSAVILGHVDSAADGPSVFFRLGALHPGDRVYVTRSDHTVAVFVVNAVREYSKASFPTATVLGATDHAALRLVTCGGSFDSGTKSYRSNIVVFAHLVGSQRSTAPTAGDTA